MFAHFDDYQVHGGFVQAQETHRGSDAHAFGRMVDDLMNLLDGKMGAEQWSVLGRGETFSTGPTVKQSFVTVFSVFASISDVAAAGFTKITAILVRTRALTHIIHNSPPQRQGFRSL
ncbi:MAG: hypothetical protein LBL95_04065 [Deltaproteobacteria bacterium]|jgi:hypothetical protein|nr:hypothetical protein [Deltaproteobacteria bacterium]